MTAWHSIDTAPQDQMILVMYQGISRVAVLRKRIHHRRAKKGWQILISFGEYVYLREEEQPCSWAYIPTQENK